MRIGKLDREVVIQRDAGNTLDAYGQPVENWQCVYTVWAEVVPTGVAERLLGPGRVATATAVFRIRWMDGIDPKTYRLVYAGRTYNILGTQEEGRRRFLLVTAVAKVD